MILDLRCFQSQNLESRRPYEVETLHVVRQSPLLCVCQVSSNLDNFGVKGLAKINGQSKKHRVHVKHDLLGFKSQSLESTKTYEVESLHILSQSLVLWVCQISSQLVNFQGTSASEEKSGQAKKFK